MGTDLMEAQIAACGLPCRAVPTPLASLEKNAKLPFSSLVIFRLGESLIYSQNLHVYPDMLILLRNVL